MVKLDDVTVTYRRHPALHHISGQFSPGSMTAVIGPNGAGKSTLIKSILGLVPLASGRFSGEFFANPRETRMAYLPQQIEIDRSFPIVVRDCVLLGYWKRVGQFGAISRDLQDRVDHVLKEVGLEGFSHRPIFSLSVGQFQRMLFARLLLQDADLILLDEPFNGIDARTTGALLNLIGSWHREGRTIIAVLHDYAQVRSHFPQCLLLARKVVAWGDTSCVLTDQNLLEAKAMVEAWDEQAGYCHSQQAA